MLASGFLSPIDTARARLQEQIGFFLSSRAKLMRLMDNPQLAIQGQARGLYVNQTTLENQFQNEMTPLLSKVQAGTWDSSDILKLTGFTYAITRQISSVDSLERQAGGIKGPSLFDGETMGILAAGALIVLGLGIMGGSFFGGRQQSQ